MFARSFFHLVYELLHVLPYLMLQYPGIDLGRGQFGMAEHFGDGFYRDPIGQGHRCGKCVPGRVEGYVFMDAACLGYFL